MAKTPTPPTMDDDDIAGHDQPLTPAGRLFLQPLMNLVINFSIAVEQPIDVAPLKAVVQNSIMLQHPRFCSLMVTDSCGRQHWRKTHVDIDRHLIIFPHPLCPLHVTNDEDAVNEYIADLSFSSPLPTDKPLWEIHILVAHKAAVFRVHHALGDGISLMSMFMSCCRRVADPSRPPEVCGVGVAEPGRRRYWSGVWTLVKSVWYSLVFIVEFVMRILWLRDKTTVLSGGAGVELWPRRLATARFRLDDMKTVKRAVDGAVLRPGVLYFLRDPADPNYNPFRDLIDDPVHKHARRVLLSVAVYGSLIVMLVFLPVKLAMRIVPSVFPLDISVSDPFTEIPADMLLFQICIPFAIEHFKLRNTLKSVIRYWFAGVGWGLGLTDFLLPKPEDNGGHDNGNADPGRQDRGHAQAGEQERLLALEDVNRPRNVVVNANPEDELDIDEPADPEWAFVLRIVLLLVVAWMTLLVFNSTLIVVPVSLGRALFNALPLLPVTHGIKCNDLYAFVIGSYVIWTALAGARYCVDLIRTRKIRLLLNQLWKWCGIILKSSALLSIWVFVIPVLIGLLFELLVIVPMRVPVDESPVFLLYQDWALGLIFLKIWTRLVMLDHMMPLMDDSRRVKFERVREDGFSRLQGAWVLKEIVFPIIMKLLTALCVPYVLSRGVFPIFGYPLVINSAVYRFAWLGCLIFAVVCFCAKRFHVWFTNLHNTIRDDRYLIGRRLHNFGEHSERRAVSESEDTVNVDENNREVAADVGMRQRHIGRQDAN